MAAHTSSGGELPHWAPLGWQAGPSPEGLESCTPAQPLPGGMLGEKGWFPVSSEPQEGRCSPPTSAHSGVGTVEG